MKKDTEMTKHILLTRKEAAENLTVSVRSIDRMISTQELSAIKIRGSIRIPLTEIENYIEKKIKNTQKKQRTHSQ